MTAGAYYEIYAIDICFHNNSIDKVSRHNMPISLLYIMWCYSEKKEKVQSNYAQVYNVE